MLFFVLPLCTTPFRLFFSLLTLFVSVDNNNNNNSNERTKENRNERTTHIHPSLILVKTTTTLTYIYIQIPIIILNAMNWNWQMLLMTRSYDKLSDCWTGHYFPPFFYCTVLYFVIDFLWVLRKPNCVASPTVIILHHLCALLYIYVPHVAHESEWCMGACMSVELNTWFLIYRRVIHKQEQQKQRTVSRMDIRYSTTNTDSTVIRIKPVSVLFYCTWFYIRCILYPQLIPDIYAMWIVRTARYGTMWNVLAIALPLHTLLCVLNFKWTHDLVLSKLRHWTMHSDKNTSEAVSRGL